MNFNEVANIIVDPVVNSFLDLFQQNEFVQNLLSIICYSVILYWKSMKFGIQEDLSLISMDIKFCCILIQNG